MTFVEYKVDGVIATITIAREEKLNAINLVLLRDLETAFAQAETDGVRACILTGKGKAFVAGADISDMQNWDQEVAESFAKHGQAVFAKIESAGFPTIAAVNGFALGGGCELAMACDFIYASDRAKFGQPEVTLGVIPGFGGTQRLRERVGIGQARELCYSGRIISAEEGKRIGLVNRMVSPNELMAEATKTALEIAACAPIAVSKCKSILLEGKDMPLSQSTSREAELFGECFQTADHAEGMKAFVEKREAAFVGK